MKTIELKTYRDIFSVRLVYHLGSILGIAPRLDFSKQKLKNSKAYKYGAFVLILLIIFGFAYSTLGRVMYIYPSLPFLSKIITDSILNVTLTVTNVCSIIMPTFVTAKSYKKFINMFTPVYHRDKVNFNQFTVMRLKGSRNQLIIIHLLIFILCFFDAYVWITFAGFHRFKYYLIRSIQNYYLIIMAYLIIAFVKLLGFRFRVLNNVLIKLSKTVLSEKVVYITDVKKLSQSCAIQTVDQILEVYCTLMDQVSLFNIIFGWQVLFLVATILASFIDALNCMITFGLTFNGLITGLSSLWTLEALILGVMCASACENAATEAYRTGQLSYKFLLSKSSYENAQRRILEDKLNILAELSTHRCPQFTAAGFFKINYTMILSLLGVVTSYFIIIIQFN